MDTYNAGNATNVSLQAADDTAQSPEIDSLLAYVQAHPRGRVYAGQPTNWGNDFTVGAVPVYKYLESKDVDEVGYTLRTASLMTDPEYFFDDTNPGDYPLFGIGYLLMPASMQPQVPAQQGPAAPATTACGRCPTLGTSTSTTRPACSPRPAPTSGPRARPCWTPPCSRTTKTGPWRSTGAAASPPTATDATALTGPPGHVVVEHANLAQGRASAVVQTKRRATVVLSASFDPGWSVTVDGHPEPTVMVAPAVVGVDVGPGTHTVTFSYGGYGSYSAVVRPGPRGLRGPGGGALPVASLPGQHYGLRARPGSEGAVSTPQPSTPSMTPAAVPAATTAPADVVVEFLEALARYDIDAAVDLVDEDLEYINVSLPTVHGRERFELMARALMRPDRLGFNVHFHHVATNGDVVLTDRVDELSFRRFATRFWVYGRFVVRDGKIAVWRDSFDWLDVTIGNLRGLLGLITPALNRRMPGN